MKTTLLQKYSKAIIRLKKRRLAQEIPVATVDPADPTKRAEGRGLQGSERQRRTRRNQVLFPVQRQVPRHRHGLPYEQDQLRQ